jgi:N-acetylglucosaminyldiphosphoundecaprenol N-acetyl-beta-D-mannosaminyltransferase
MLLGYNIFKSTLRNIDLNHNKIINTINPHSYCVSKQDETFEIALKASDILLPDGIGIVWAENFLNNTVIKKNCRL